MKDCNCDLRDGDAKTAVFGSNEMLQPAPVDTIPMEPTTPQIAYQMVKDETFAQTQPRLNLATFVTTYMDDYATKLMNEAININYIDETEYPRIAVMNAKCINIMANLWNSPEQAKWKSGALAIGSSEACMLGGVAAWLRWRDRRKAQGKPTDKPNFVISSGFQVVWEKFAQLWQIEMRQVPLTLDKTTLDPEEALKMCDENTICIVPIQGVTWTGLNDDVEALDKALDAYNAKTVPQPRNEMGLPFEMGSFHQHFRPQVRTGLSGTGMGSMERQEIPSGCHVVQCQLSGCEHHTGWFELQPSRRTDSGTVLPIYPSGIPRIQSHPIQFHGNHQVHSQRNSQDGSVRKLQRQSGKSFVHLVHETRIRKERQMDSVRFAG